MIDPQHRIFLGGYGLGAAAALHYGLESERIPAGIVGINGYLLPGTRHVNLGRLPMLLLHGANSTILN